MRPRLPPLDTSEYVSCPIDTPLLDFDQKSPLPCIIVTPSSPTEYHIAFHHKSSPLYLDSFAAQQQRRRRRPLRTFLNSLTSFVAPGPPSLPATAVDADVDIARAPLKRTTLVLAVPLFIIVCHMLASAMSRGAARGGSGGFFGGSARASVARGGFSSAAAHMRALKAAQPPPLNPQLPDLHTLD